MPLINEELKFKPNNQSANFNSNNAQATEAAQTQPKGLLTLPPALMQIIPWIPFALEAFTGQKIPAIGGTIGEIQSSLQQIQFSLTQLLNNQQQLYTRLESLENNASSQLTNLSQQIANTNQDFKLLATETKRSLEFSQSRRINEPEREM